MVTKKSTSLSVGKYDIWKGGKNITLTSEEKKEKQTGGTVLLGWFAKFGMSYFTSVAKI